MNMLSRLLMGFKTSLLNNKVLATVCLLMMIVPFLCIYHMGDEFKTNWGDRTQFVAAVVTIVSILFVIATLRQTQSLYEAELLMKYDEKYGSPEMSDALRVLRKVAFLPAFANCNTRSASYNPDSGLGVSVPYGSVSSVDGADAARRLVKFYFINVLDYYRSGKISQDVARRIFNKTGITLFFSVVEPMENCLNSKYDYTKFREIMMLSSDIWKKQKQSDIVFYNAEMKRLNEVVEQQRKNVEKSGYKGAIIAVSAIVIAYAVKNMFRR